MLRLLPTLIMTFLLFVVSVNEADAIGCMSGACHQDLAKIKHMHGPVAAEMAGVNGCVMCHEPTGSDCTSSRGGKFLLKQKGMCLSCHIEVTCPENPNPADDTKCLNCHSPHGSNESPLMLRSKR